MGALAAATLAVASLLTFAASSVVAQEVLIGIDAVRACVRDSKTPQLLNIMQTGAKYGMRTLESILNEHVGRGLVAYNTAVIKANHPRLIQKNGQIPQAQPMRAR